MAGRDGRRVARLRRALADREARLAELKQRLDALEGSTSMQLGRVLTTAARRPGRGVVRLPADLYRLWRGRRVGGRTKLPTPQPVRQADLAREEERLVVGGRTLGSYGPLIAGVLAPSAAEALAGCARVIPLLPHDAELLLDSAEPDLLLVTASAATEPGSAWAGVGDPAAGDLERVLRRTIAAARDRSIPVVLWRDAPAPPGLHRLHHDLVVEGDLGTPLHLTGATPNPQFEGRILGADLQVSLQNPSPKLGVGELRRVFLGEATPVRVAAVLAALDRKVVHEVPQPPEGHGLPVRAGTGGDPLAGRRVTVVARVADDARAAAVAGEVAAQTHPATELILLVPDERAAGPEPPTFGLPARVLPERGFTAARTVRTPWMAPWPDVDPGPDHLLDLAAAAECSGAEAIGDDGTGRSYAFTAGPIVPALVRRELTGSPPDWTARGVRQYALPATQGTRPPRPTPPGTTAAGMSTEGLGG